MFLETKPDVKINVKTYGEKENPAVIMLHGIGADHEMFLPQINEFKEEGFFLIVSDMRGHGKSSKVNKLSLDDFTYDIKEILKYFDIDKAIVIGVSMGGVIAQKFVVDYPEKVKKIIIVDSFGELSSLKEKMIGKFQVFGFKVFNYLPKILGANLFASAYKGVSKNTEQYFREKSLKIDYDQLVLARKAINQIDIIEKLKKVEVDSLVIAGGKIEVMVEASKKIAEGLNNSKLVIIEDSMDPSNLVFPDKFNKEVLKFIK
ncbi:MAG: alpha/beta fold hydrolase [Bacillota bacterium]